MAELKRWPQRMNKIYVTATSIGAIVFAAYYNWQLAPNPWIVEDSTSGKSSICEVHNSTMEKKKVNVIYGYGAPSSWIKENAPHQMDRDAFIREEERSFPNARDKVIGDCLVSNKAPASAYIYTCVECGAALQKWHQSKTANQAVFLR